jgi:polygalacturonase
LSNGKTLATAAIQKAVAAGSQGGSGTVKVPAGTYLLGTITLKIKVNLHLRPWLKDWSRS